ncbi:hypothetical protein FRC04_003691 [Tulasnella sp. 424]|nr:hypothetical protein FRC04_003691 [Tulasnella sp. 424]
MQFSGFVAPLVIRAFPFITGLPVGAIQAQGETKTIFKRLAKRLVEQCKSMQSEEVMKNGKDLMNVLLKYDEKAEAEDLDQLLDHIYAFVTIGHETTSDALNLSILELARRPEIQEKPRK